MTEAKTTAKTEKNEGQLCMPPQLFGMPNVLMDSSCPYSVMSYHQFMIL